MASQQGLVMKVTGLSRVKVRRPTSLEQFGVSEISVEFLENSVNHFGVAMPPHKLSLSLVLFSFLILSSPAQDAAPFYAFQNGVRLQTHEKRAELLAELGYDGIGSASLPGPANVEAMFAAYQSRGLKVFSFYTGGNVTQEGGTPAVGLYEAIPKLKDRGIVLELFLQGNRGLDLDEKAVEWIREVAKQSEESGVKIVLYPHTGFYIETIGDAVRIAKQVDRENVGVMFNLCHFLRIEPEADLAKTLKEAQPFLKQVSVSGADQGGRDWKALIQPLGKGTYDVAPLIQILDEVGFDGPVGLQCYNVAGQPEVFLKQSIEAWKELSK